MNDVADYELSPAGVRSIARNRDAEQSPFGVHHTDPASFLDDVIADAKLGAIEHKIVRRAIRTTSATLAQVEYPKVSAGGHRDTPAFRAKHVIASYQARGQLVQLDVYCGVYWARQDEAPTEAHAELTKQTALQLQATLRRLVVPLMKLDLDVRGGGVAIQDPSDHWLAHYLESIETPAPVVCQHCGEEIYYSNEAWRHVATKRAEHLVDAIGRGTGKVVKKVDHYAEPEEEAT